MPQNPRSRYLRLLAIGVLIGAAITLVVLAGLPEVPRAISKTRSPSAGDQADSSVVEEGAKTVSVGQTAPNFALHDTRDRTYELQGLKGKVVLLNFWATWCAPCRLEMPLLEAISQELVEEDFLVLGINLQESVAQVQEFVDEMGLTFPVLLDSDGTVSGLYRIIGYPSTIIIDKAGKIQTIHIGILLESQLREYLQEAGLSI